MQLKIPLCPKHQKPAIIICSFQSCKDPILCEVCKQKQILHFSNHANYFQKLQKIKQFDNAKRTQQQLEKGIADCQAFVVEHRKFYSQQITAIKEDFLQMRKLFMSIADKYEQIYILSFKKQIQKFDQQINSLKRMLREYVEQKNQQQSIFNIFFPNNQPDKQNDQSLQGLIKKNSKAFKVRADIINLRSSLAISKNSQIKYKATQGSQNNLRIIFQQLDSVSKAIYDKFKDVLFADSNINDDLKGSIVNQSKSLAISKVSVGNLMDLYKSQATNSTSQPILQNVQFPPLDPVVNSVRQKLRPIQPKNPNIAFEGPYLYSTGVYYGQYQNKKRHGWGQFAFHNGSIYQGQWQNDAISGYGRLIRNDCYYEGDVRNGKANGSGTYEDHYRHYSGQWKNDKRNGIGQQEYKNKQKSFTGGFLDDKYHGKGRLITPEYVYEGKFKQGLFNGDGRIKYKNDQIFEGNFVDGQKHMGRHTYPDGSYYDGMYKDNVPNGTGQFFWSDGVKYSGQWRGGIQEGAGVQILQNGKEMKGIWRNGKWQKWI